MVSKYQSSISNDEWLGKTQFCKIWNYQHLGNSPLLKISINFLLLFTKPIMFPKERNSIFQIQDMYKREYWKTLPLFCTYLWIPGLGLQFGWKISPPPAEPQAKNSIIKPIPLIEDSFGFPFFHSLQTFMTWLWEADF